MENKPELSEVEKKFLEAYQKKAFHRLREILKYGFILDKLTNK